MNNLSILAALGFLIGPAGADYRPVAEQVVDNAYAIVGPLGPRSVDNDGLNANYGFVVTGEGVILIDSWPSRLGAVTGEPVR